jgi:hypothetical protein
MSWEPLLLNQFLIEYAEEHDSNVEFHYPWMLILIVFAAWEEMEHVNFLSLRGKKCLEAEY